MKYKGQTDYDHKGISPRRGVLLCNLGTPDAPDKASLKRYLKEFLSDPRVVEVPRPIWWMILHGVILNIRPAKSAKLYQSVWTEEGSPLMVHSLHQQKKLQTLLDKEHGENHIPVVLGMRYGNPSIASALDQLAAQNVREIIVLPLYPQYSGATGGSTFDASILGLASLAETRDNETGAHILRTQNYVRVLAEHLSLQEKYRPQLNAETIDLLYKSAPLHDVGKVGIPDSILLKPGKLTDEEFNVMKSHAQIGADALQVAEDQLGSNSFLRIAREISLTHHEKWDGSGYPVGLKAENIPLSGRLMALADVYDALRSKRVYKPAFSHEKAKEIILEGRGSHFDPAIVDAFLSLEGVFIDIAETYQDAHPQEST